MNKTRYFYALVIGIKLSYASKMPINLNADRLYEEAKGISTEQWDQWLMEKFHSLHKSQPQIPPNKRTSSVVSNLRFALLLLYPPIISLSFLIYLYYSQIL